MKNISPTKPGYYWAKDKGDPSILRVDFAPIIHLGLHSSGSIKSELHWFLLLGTVSVKFRKYSWVGPLRAPTKKSKKYREKLPTTSGWYWCIAPSYIDPRLVKLFRFPNDPQLYLFLQFDLLATPVTKESSEGFKWYGPLQPPKKLISKNI